MFFFSKKEFLIDQFSDGLIDIHNHLLPCLDDGSTSMETTVEMIELMKECNISKAFVTPHIMEDFYELNTKKIASKFEEVQSEIKQNYPSQHNFLLDYASEYMIDGQFETLLENRNLKCIKGKYLLCELSYFQKPINLEDLLFKIIGYGYQPILAHPERYRYLSFEELRGLKDKGFLFQANLLSFSGHYGKDALAKSEFLAKEGLYTFVGTDAHKSEHLKIIEEMQIKKKFLEQIRKAVDSHKEIFS